MDTLAYLLARFSEPSSYAGVGAVLALAGLHFSDNDLGQIAQLLAAGCGLAALLLKERGMIKMLVLTVLAATTLGACSNPGSTPATTALPSPTQIIAVGQSAAQTAGAAMTDVQAGMCEAQAIANLTSQIAAVAGDGTVAADASKASTAAGLGCTWTNPTPAAPVAAAGS